MSQRHLTQVHKAEENPNSEVLGTDLSPIQPDYLPPNCRFEIDDVDDDWVHSHKFDYIHGRYLLPFVKKDWNLFFKSIEVLIHQVMQSIWACCKMAHFKT